MVLINRDVVHVGSFAQRMDTDDAVVLARSNLKELFRRIEVADGLFITRNPVARSMTVKCFGGYRRLPTLCRKATRVFDNLCPHHAPAI